MKLSELFEARKNPELNPKIGMIAQLLKYKDNHDIYFSMTKLPKLGINPQSGWFNTPNGIYTFNLSEFFDGITNLDRSLSSILPRPFDRMPYVHIIKANNVKTLDINKYTEAEYNNDVNKLISLHPELKDKILEFQQNIKYHDREYSPGNLAFAEIDLDHPFIKIFGLTRAISKSTSNWNARIRDLGYLIVNDPGRRWISRYESQQTVFLSPKAYTHIDTLKVVEYHNNTSKAGEKITKKDIPSIISSAKISHKRTTKYEPLIMQSVSDAIDYAEALGGRFNRYEKKVLSEKDTWSATQYYSKIIAPKRWPELEKLLPLDPQGALRYSIRSHFRIKENEPAILNFAKEHIDEYSGVCQYANELVEYAARVIKGPWSEAEQLIKTHEWEYKKYLENIHNIPV